jgi:hypothetical protein
MMERFGGKQTGFTSASEKCPCFPASTCAVHSRAYKPENRNTDLHGSCPPSFVYAAA